ncbi:MAG: chemotaxis protein CheA [Planctomycetota bacterium]
MSLPELDPELLQDFLTESGELVEQLDMDLVELESAEDQPAMLDQIFRALHTIKGAASFLALSAVTTHAHAAEDALNKLRKGEAEVTQDAIDALLRSVDVLKGQLDAVASSAPADEAPADLLQALNAIGSGSGGPASADDAATASAAGGPAAPTSGPGGAQLKPISLPPEKLDLMPFMADDLVHAKELLDGLIARLPQDQSEADIRETLIKVGEDVTSTAEFFDFDGLRKIASMIQAPADMLEGLPAEIVPQLAARFTALSHMLDDFAQVLKTQHEPIWDLSTLEERMIDLACGNALPEDANAPENPDPVDVLLLDGVYTSQAINSQPGEAASTPDASGAAPSEQKATGPKKELPPTEATLRVEVSRLEELLNMVGELTLAKNRMNGLGRRLTGAGVGADLLEEVNATFSELDRVTGQLQLGVMRTRMQPLSRLFSKYTRVVRDLARSTDKKIDLVIEGGDTECDKSVIELLGDPLVHMIRNSADHGVEPPDVRREKGKPETGRILLSADNKGGHVRILVQDDGKGLDRNVLAAKAVEKGICTAEQAAALPDGEVFKFIFAAGLSTASQVSDLSGRGVGMDVVRTNINKLSGTINVASSLGVGTTIEIIIPLTVAILPAMIVRVGAAEYAIPIATIVEIVRPEPAMTGSVNSAPVLKLRGQVLPIIDLVNRLGEHDDDDSRFAVVVEAGSEQVALMVHGLVGQREVVIKPLDDAYTTGGPFSGATIREDGQVSLILDIMELVRSGQESAALVAA